MMREMDFVDECYADKDLSLLKKLTLVIPTYNRNYYLSRCLWYHAHFPFGEIIVADSSPEKKKVVNRETVQKIRERFAANIRYLEYEPETEKYGGDIYRKWGDAVQHVETEYSQIVTDKEFLIPDTACKCIYYLEISPDYMLVDGKHHSIEQSPDQKYMYTSLPTVTRNEDDSWERFLKMTENPGCTLLALHRTQTMKQAYTSLVEHNVNDIRFGEIYLELQSVILGKAMTVNDTPLIYRDTITFEKEHGQNKLKESSSFRYPQLWEYDKTERDKYYASFKNGVVASLSKTTQAQQEQYLPLVDTVLQNYISKRMGKAHPLRRFTVIKKLFYHLPKKIQRYILRTIMGDACGVSDFVPKDLHDTHDSNMIIKIINDTTTQYK